MGYTTYSVQNAVSRSSSRLTMDSLELHSTVFEQQALRKIHEKMVPTGTDRECRDSEAHPNVIPIILGLDVTGSMGSVPEYLVKEGLPKLMGSILEHKVDSAVMFCAIGDHKYDRVPFQVGQFESGDEELDIWLTRTFLEGGGGGNGGESYMLAWYYAAFHVKTDAWEKRGQKGLLITFGDEPNHKTLSANSIKEIFGDDVERAYTSDELLELAREKWNVYHVTVRHSSTGRSTEVNEWRENLGPKNALTVIQASEVSDLLVDVVEDLYKNEDSQQVETTQETNNNPSIVTL